MNTQGTIGPVLVTGASTGIGRAITEFLSKHGRSVFAGARGPAVLEELNRLKGVTSLRLDVTSPEDVREAKARIQREGRGLYGLVNNAGIVDLWPLGETSDEDLRLIFDVNVFGVHRVTRAMLPLLIESHGRIVNISSISGLGTSARIGSYSMTKHAIEAWSEAMARQLDRYGVQVSVIEPGGYGSNISRSAAEIVRKRASTKSTFLMEREVEQWLSRLDEEVRLQEEAPAPEPVAEAVSDALFSNSPRLRYVVTPNEEELLWALEELIWRTVLANRGATFSLTREGLDSLLDKAWKRTVGL